MQAAQVPFKGIHHKDGIVPGRESRVVWSDQLEAHVAEGPQQGTCGGEGALERGAVRCRRQEDALRSPTGPRLTLV